MRGIHRSPVDSPHKGPLTRKKFSFDDVILLWCPGCFKILRLMIKGGYRLVRIKFSLSYFHSTVLFAKEMTASTSGARDNNYCRVARTQAHTGRSYNIMLDKYTQNVRKYGTILKYTNLTFHRVSTYGMHQCRPFYTDRKKLIHCHRLVRIPFLLLWFILCVMYLISHTLNSMIDWLIIFILVHQQRKHKRITW